MEAPKTGSSWALPLLHEQILHRKPVAKGAEQLRLVCHKLKVRPLSLWDSEYGCAAFVQATATVPADTLIRLRTNLCLEGPPKPKRHPRGPAPKHGDKFKFQDPTTWWQTDQQDEYETGEFGRVVVRIWLLGRPLVSLRQRSLALDLAQARYPTAISTLERPDALSDLETLAGSPLRG